MSRTVASVLGLTLSMVAPVSAQDASECQFENAFGQVYDITTSSNNALVDLCIDRETGSVSGLLSVSNLTLTLDDGVNFTFEDLDGGSGNMMQIAPVVTSTYHKSDVLDQSPEVNVLVGTEFFVGFIYDDLAAPSDLASEFVVHLGGGLSVPGGSPLGFQGMAQFVDGVASIALSDHPGYGTTKGTEGTIEIVVADDGTVTGFGSLATENIRSAGFGANEWVSMTVTIDELRGFATGPTGQVIKTFALVTADIIDAEGDEVQVQGAFEVFLFDPQIWE